MPTINHQTDKKDASVLSGLNIENIITSNGSFCNAEAFIEYFTDSFYHYNFAGINILLT